MPTIYVVTEEVIDYDWEETPILEEVTLLKAFPQVEMADEYIADLCKKMGYSSRSVPYTIKEVELAT